MGSWFSKGSDEPPARPEEDEAEAARPKHGGIIYDEMRKLREMAKDKQVRGPRAGLKRGLDGEEGEDFVAFREVHDLESCKVAQETEIWLFATTIQKGSNHYIHQHSAPTWVWINPDRDQHPANRPRIGEVRRPPRASGAHHDAELDDDEQLDELHEESHVDDLHQSSTRTVTSLRGSWKQAEENGRTHRALPRRADLNCYWGAGAATAEGKDFVGLLSAARWTPVKPHFTKTLAAGAEAKQVRCVSAGTITIEASFGGRVGNCWLRSKVDLPKCVKVPGYSLWLEASEVLNPNSSHRPEKDNDNDGCRVASPERSMKLPAVLLALASLVDGSCLLENKEKVLKCATTEGCVDGEQVDATCLGACLQSDGVQQNCAGCLGEGLSCAVANCQNQCSPGHPNYYSSQCTQCLRQEKCRTCAFVAQTVNEVANATKSYGEVANLAALALEAKAERSVDLPKAGGFCYEERCEFSSAAPKGMHCQLLRSLNKSKTRRMSVVVMRRKPTRTKKDQAKLKKCGTECLTRPQRAQCATDCLRREGMKPGCARCFGDKVDCTIRARGVTGRAWPWPSRRETSRDKSG
ncbi:unnamed protein product [Durusdinium trenchii]|uniref:Uncharacterized protein n=1 Tax=Durusdinium trenchii TaxID=1381693 RepID=A0ABP0JCD3_9DINO